MLLSEVQYAPFEASMAHKKPVTTSRTKICSLKWSSFNAQSYRNDSESFHGLKQREKADGMVAVMVLFIYLSVTSNLMLF